MDGFLRQSAIKRRTVLGTGLAALLAGSARADDDCRMVRRAALDMIPFGDLVVIEDAIGDKPVRMLVDTGGWLTCFSEAIATALNLPVEQRPEEGIVMYGGLPLRRFVTLSDFRIGRMKAPRLTYPLLPPDRLPEGVDGLLAPDFLANFDLDFDFAGGKFNLFSKDHCPGRVGYWTTEKLQPIPIVREEDGAHISTHVSLDGKDIKANIDTGASMTVMSMGTARWMFGIASDDPLLKVDHTFDNLKNTKRYPFKQMMFGNVRVENPEIILVPDSESQMGPNGPSLILGLTVLRRMHVYIAYREKNLYVTDKDVHL